MEMRLILCTLSPKRLAQVKSEPEMVEDIVEAEPGEIPGWADLGPCWDALSLMLGGEARGGAAEALFGRTGEAIGPKLSVGPARVLAADKVTAVAAMLPKDPEGFVKTRFKDLFGKKVHGGYGADVEAKGDSEWLKKRTQETQRTQIAELTQGLNRLVALYQEAARNGHAMLIAII